MGQIWHVMAQLLPELNSLAQPFVKLHRVVVTSRHSSTKDDSQGIWIIDQWRIYIVKFWTRAPPRGSKFFQFHAVFGKFEQNCMLAPPPRGNPGSATVDDVTETQLPINIADGTKVLISRKQIY